MDGKIRALLVASDEIGTSYEFPPGFEWETLRGRVVDVAQQLKPFVGPVLLDDNAQDASFCFEIHLDQYTLRQARTIYRPTIRFSNFGDLVTMTLDTMLSGDIYTRCIGVLTKHGFHYVPSWQLDLPYDGPRVERVPAAPWWIRYSLSF